MTILTPMDNEISVINATTPDKFAVAMTVEHQRENWQGYWEDFRLYVSARHQWRDGLKPEQHEDSR